MLSSRSHRSRPPASLASLKGLEKAALISTFNSGTRLWRSSGTFVVWALASIYKRAVDGSCLTTIHPPSQPEPNQAPVYIDEELDEQMSNTLLSSGSEDIWPFLQQTIWQGGVPLLTSWTACRPIHSFRMAVVGFATSIELQFESELVTAAEVVMIDFCPCAADSAMVDSAFSPS
jgi:hypothetical protein